MNLGERILQYRAKHRLTQREMADLINENANMIFRCEKGDKLHTVNRMRIDMKLKELEKEENV